VAGNGGFSAGASTAELGTHLPVAGERLYAIDVPETYEGMLGETASRFPLSCMIPGILKHADLPDLVRAVKSKLC